MDNRLIARNASRWKRQRRENEGLKTDAVACCIIHTNVHATMNVDIGCA